MTLVIKDESYSVRSYSRVDGGGLDDVVEEYAVYQDGVEVFRASREIYCEGFVAAAELSNEDLVPLTRLDDPWEHFGYITARAAQAVLKMRGYPG